jgi:ribosomal protein L5
MLTEEFFEAEFYKFLTKFNRALMREEKELLHFSFQKSGFVNVGVWDKKNFSGTSYSFNIEKQGVNSDVYQLQSFE